MTNKLPIREFLFFPIVLAVFLLPLNVQAGESSYVQKQKADEAKCQKTWESLWSKVQAENVEARVGLVQNMLFGDILALPGRSGDYLSRHRDIMILAVHSVGLSKDHDKLLDPFYYKYLTGLASNKDFFKCIETKRAQACAQILVDDHIVPPFQDYVNEINTMIAAGKKPICVFHPDMTIELQPPTINE